MSEQVQAQPQPERTDRPERSERGGDKRGFGRGKQQQRRPRKDGADTESWTPVTKLGRLVKDKLIKKLEEIYLFFFTN